MAALVENIQDYLPDRPLTVLTGVLRDKDYHRMYAPAAALCGAVHHRDTGQSPALPAQELAAYLQTLGRPVTPCDTVAEGAALALAKSANGGAVLCCGSLYLMGEAEAALLR